MRRPVASSWRRVPPTAVTRGSDAGQATTGPGKQHAELGSLSVDPVSPVAASTVMP
jgi:hypothetical protein